MMNEHQSKMPAREQFSYQYHQDFSLDQQRRHNKWPICGFVRTLIHVKHYSVRMTKKMLNWFIQEAFVKMFLSENGLEFIMHIDGF